MRADGTLLVIDWPLPSCQPRWLIKTNQFFMNLAAPRCALGQSPLEPGLIPVIEGVTHSNEVFTSSSFSCPYSYSSFPHSRPSSCSFFFASLTATSFFLSFLCRFCFFCLSNYFFLNFSFLIFSLHFFYPFFQRLDNFEDAELIWRGYDGCL